MVERIVGTLAEQPKGNPMNTPTNHAEAGNNPKQHFRRRHYLIDRRRQLAATVRIAGMVLVLLVTLNGVIARQSYTATNQIMARNPELGEIMRATDLRNLIILAGLSLIILAMVVVRSIMYTHRTAGAVFKVTQCMEKIAAGDFDVTLRFRGDDSLRDLEEPFDRMAKTLKRFSDEDYRAVTRLADEIEENGSPENAKVLRKIAESIEQRAG